MPEASLWKDRVDWCDGASPVPHRESLSKTVSAASPEFARSRSVLLSRSGDADAARVGRTSEACRVLTIDA